MPAPTEVVVVEHDDFRKKAAQEEREAAQERGAIPLLNGDYEIVIAMVDKARAILAESEVEAIRELATPDESIIYNEVTAAWVDPCGKAWARARMDRLRLAARSCTVIDYKTTELSASPAEVAGALYRNNYHFQDAFYRRGLRILLPEIDRHEMKLDFFFFVQEQKPPYEITVARCDPAARVIGEKMVSAAFLRWRKCVEENHWPGYPGEIVTAEFPAYMDTRWTAREIEDPHLQNLGVDPVPPYEASPYKPKPITEPC